MVFFLQRLLDCMLKQSVFKVLLQCARLFSLLPIFEMLYDEF